MAVMENPVTTEKGKTVALLVLVALIGTGLRAYQLGAQSLWHDEILTFLSSNGTLAHVLFQTEIKTHILPLYYLVVHAFLSLGDQDVFLRIPSVIFGSLTIPLFYYTVRHSFGTELGLWASSLLAISPFHIFYSQEARPYAMFLFLCLLAFFLLQQSIEKKEGRFLKLSFAIVGASTFYCHTAAIPFLAFLGFYLFLNVPRTEWKDWVYSLLVFSVLLLPAVYRAVTLQEGEYTGRSFEVFYFPYVLWSFLTGFSLGPNLFELHLDEKLEYIVPHLKIILPILIFISGLVFYGARKTFQQDRKTFLVFVVFFFLPLIFISLAAIGTSRPFNVRHIIPSVLPFLVFMSVGIQSVKNRSLQILCVGFLIIISLFSLGNYYFEDRYHREDNKGAAEFLTINSLEHDLVICATHYTKLDLLYYLPPSKATNIVSFPIQTMHAAGTLPQEILQALNGRQRFWVFYSRTFDSNSVVSLKQYFDENYSSTLGFDSTGVKLVRYEVVTDFSADIPQG